MSQAIEETDQKDTVTESVTATAPSEPLSSEPLSSEPLATAEENRSWLGTAVSCLPSILVFGALAGLATFGHHHDWKLPSFAAMTGSGAPDELAWCDRHGVPEEACIVCDPSLIEAPPKLEFCNEHGVHGCVLHRPELAETRASVTPTSRDLQRAIEALALMPRAENLPLSSSAGSRIQFASIDAMKKAGVDVEPVERRPVTEALDASSEIQYNATKTAQVSPPADGTVRRVYVEIGDWVTEGQTLAVIDSREVGQLKTELIAAIAQEQLSRLTVDRLRPLAGQAISGKRLLDAENELQQSQALVDRMASGLINLGLNVDLKRLRSLAVEESTSYVRGLGLSDKDSSGGNLISVLSPLEGRIVRRNTTVGEVVDRGSELFRVVDTRTVWLDLRVPAERASLIREGLVVEYFADGGGEPRTGEVTWISTDVDPTTRTVRVRAVLENADGSLRNESFGQGRIILRHAEDAIVVPERSLQWDGASHVVFVRDAKFFDKDRPKFFIARSVRPGATQDGFVEILAGVLPGEVVATDGSDVLRAQLLRSNLGAGCTCGH